MIHYGTYRGAAVGLRGAAVGNIGIPTYVISRGAVVRQPSAPGQVLTTSTDLCSVDLHIFLLYIVVPERAQCNKIQLKVSI